MSIYSSYSIYCFKFWLVILINVTFGLHTLTQMVLILDGNSEQLAHVSRKIGPIGEENPICDSSRYNQMP